MASYTSHADGVCREWPPVRRAGQLDATRVAAAHYPAHPHAGLASQTQRSSSKVKVVQNVTVGCGISQNLWLVICYGRPNYAMTSSYQWTSINVYLMQN